MIDDSERLIAALAQDLKPVRAFRRRDGLMLVALALIATIGAVLMIKGARSGLDDGGISVFFLLANGILLMLGLASATAVVTMASPRVSNRYDGPRWALATAAVLPLAAVVLLFVHRAAWQPLLGPTDGMHCFLDASLSSLAIAAALLAWLKRGAPVAPERSGLLLGVAAGALGSFAYGLSCPVDTLFHLAIWHFLPVLVVGLAGRAVVPAIIRW